MDSRGFAAKHVYPSPLGLHIEHYTTTEAQAAYADAKSRGINNVELNGLILTWKFYNPKINPHPVASPTRRGNKRRSLSRCRLQRLQLLQLPGVTLGKKLSRLRKAARPSHFEK